MSGWGAKSLPSTWFYCVYSSLVGNQSRDIDAKNFELTCCCTRVIPCVIVTIFAAIFGLSLAVNYLLLVGDQLLFAYL